MNIIDSLLLAKIYQTAKISVIENEIILNHTSNDTLKTILSNQTNNYYNLTTECTTLAKANKIDLPSNTFFKQCEEILQTYYTDIQLNSPSQLLVGAINSTLHTLKDIYDYESADSETIQIGKHLQNMQIKYLDLLKEIAKQN